MTVSAQAPKLPCDARGLRRLRNSPSSRAQTVLADNPSARCASRRHQRGTAPIPCGKILPSLFITTLLIYRRQLITDCHGSSVAASFRGPLMHRRAAQQRSGFRRGLSEGAQRPSSAAAERCEQRRAVAAGDRGMGGPFLWQLYFGQAKESCSPSGESFYEST